MPRGLFPLLIVLLVIDMAMPAWGKKHPPTPAPVVTPPAQRQVEPARNPAGEVAPRIVE